MQVSDSLEMQVISFPRYLWGKISLLFSKISYLLSKISLLLRPEMQVSDSYSLEMQLPKIGPSRDNCQLPQWWGQEAMSNPHLGCGDARGWGGGA